MRQIAGPAIAARSAYQACRQSVNEPLYRQRLQDGEKEFLGVSADYFIRAGAAVLYTFQAIDPNEDDTAVLRDLTKADLVKLYEYHMVRRQPGRALYNKLSIASKKKCPSCGGIGHVYTLDHYLPKAELPQFSICPANLLPCCRDCNSEKGSSVADSPGGQVLHPYFDANHFYTDVWVVAQIQRGREASANFSVQPPATWTDDDKERVAAHFREYNLSERYAVEAASELVMVVDQWPDIYEPMTVAQRQAHFAAMARGSCINDWKPVLYRALSQDVEVCRHGLFP